MLAATAPCGEAITMVLWLIAAVVGIVGLFRLLSGDFVFGIVLIVVAFLIGPGGVSLFC